MKKLLIALIALTTLAIFVACNPAKDPVKDNLAIGKWEGEVEGAASTVIVLTLEVKSDKTATMVAKLKSNPDIGETYKGSWTATSISEGTISLVNIKEDTETIEGPFKVESGKLTLTIEAFGEPKNIELKKAVK